MQNNIEDELYQAEAIEQAKFKTNQRVLQKLDDLENRLSQSNLRFVGIPESLQASALTEFCTRRILEALHLPAPFTVERATVLERSPLNAKLFARSSLNI